MIEIILNCLFVFSFILSVVSAYIVFENRTEAKGFIINLLDGIDVFFTDRALNEKGKKWRLPFIFSVLYMIGWLYFK